MHVVVAGSSGFLGRQLVTELRGRGHDVTCLVRRDPSPGQDSRESRWDPQGGVVDSGLVQGADVVVNLAGSPLIGNPHSTKWAREVLTSRRATTRLLATTIAAAASPPALVNASGVSWYGDHGSAELTEASDTRGHALLTRVAREWEEAAQPASGAGARVVLLRTAPVQDRRNAPLRQQRLQFLAGLGGRLGNGRQYYPLISLRDWVGAAAFLVEHPTASGPVNLCAPNTPTNAEFTRTLARLVHRPAVLPAPAAAIRLAAGPMADEVLGSLNLRPAALLDLGYGFADPDVASVLATGLRGGPEAHA
ncbi:TIGR01777 family oxidoreductase [Nocardioides daeguensis]|uniref:TIGR01777 family oxidoreductase n=1 Tax=Nocardioides daeguensis TaxID=908359 RepID=A0ABP6VXD0_9ACTN|nr:TIGR01777 family oxidoreductase [Nocardioides daeguensis]MBV6726951.1 TIGR01777 family oxidoreductase [Nocardioides daeguensis]MCR1772950.1 TIGR01777 family oxidoreductase [Nocardioides daeguensis]